MALRVSRRIMFAAPFLAAPGAITEPAAAAEGVTIEWREGSALQLPLADEAFDVVVCQQGLQFFPDQPAALREMHRVLAPGGRLMLGVWREIEPSPGFMALAEALTRHVTREAATPMTSGAFGLSSTEELRRLVAGARFKDISVRPDAKVLRYPSPDEFLLRYVAGSPLAAAMAGADEAARSALLAEVAERLQSYVDEHGMAFPIESNIVTAHR